MTTEPRGSLNELIDSPISCSILLPVRSDSQFLGRCIDSLLWQSYSSWQLVAVLDRDTGINESLLVSRIPKSKLKIIHADFNDGGLSHLLNTGLDACDSELIARFDDDDISVPSRLERQVGLFSQLKDLVLVATTVEVVNQFGETLYWIHPPEIDEALKSSLLTSNQIVHSSVMMKKSAVMRVGGYQTNLHGCEDYDLWLRLVSQGRFAAFSEKLVTYYQNPLGLSKKGIPYSAHRLLKKSRDQAAIELGVTKSKNTVTSLRWRFNHRPHVVRFWH